MAMGTQLVPLQAAVQNYAWGNPGSASLVAEIHAKNALTTTDPAKPYAELWIGTHPSGPAQVISHDGDTLSTLAEYLDPSSVRIPYLLKILSVSKALSIQAHPNKELAVKLHAESPDVYKDDNHKPEMSVALTRFEAMCNFRPVEAIARDFNFHEELGYLIGQESCKSLTAAVTAGDQHRKNALKTAFEALMRKSPEQIMEPLARLQSKISAKDQSDRSDQESLFLKLIDQYPGDIGCFGAFLLNYVVIEEGQAFFMAANEPHAYLSGQCVEIMACSDNVVRAGLTPKFKDVDTLLEMLSYNDGPPEVTSGVKVNEYTKVFQPPVSEFQLERVELPVSASMELSEASGPGVILVVSGEGTASSGEAKWPLSAGRIYFVPQGIKLAFVTSKASTRPLLLFRAGINELSGPIIDTVAVPPFK